MSLKDEHGFALPMAIFAMLIAAVIIAGGTFLGHQELHVGIVNSKGIQALYLAERGLSNTMLQWDWEAFSSLPLWVDTTLVDTLETGIVATAITRVGPRMYVLEAVSTVTEGRAILSGASRRTGLVVRLFTADIDPPAALTTRGNTSVSGNAEVHGGDVDPPEWGGLCSFPVENKPGVLTDHDGTVSTLGQGELTGDPAFLQDSAISDSTFTQFGEMSWDDLVTLADLRLPGGNINETRPEVESGVCSTSVLTNWGDPLDPTAPCGGYFPIIHVDGDALIQSAGVGQGLLLVEGNLELRGGFVFHGVIIVQGDFETQGNGNRVFGGVLASNADIENQSLTGGSVIQNSTCAVSRAILNSKSLNRPRPLGIRSWVDLSSASN